MFAFQLPRQVMTREKKILDTETGTAKYTEYAKISLT